MARNLAEQLLPYAEKCFYARVIRSGPHNQIKIMLYIHSSENPDQSEVVCISSTEEELQELLRSRRRVQDD